MAKDVADYTVHIHETDEGWEIEYFNKGVYQFSETVGDMNAVRFCLAEYFDG